MKYVAFDIEAANGYKAYSICSVGVVTADDKLNITGKENIWINPRTKYNLNGTREHVGINLNLDPTVLAAAPDFKETYPRLKEILEDGETIVIGHAVDSDIIMLNAACIKYKLPPINFSYLCTQLLFKRYKEERDVRSLSKIAAEIGVEFNAHSSDDDALASLLTLKYLCEKTKLTAEELCKKYDVRKGVTIDFKVDRCISLAGNVNKNISRSAINAVRRGECRRRNPILKDLTFSFSRRLELGCINEITALVRLITYCGGIYTSKIGKCSVYIDCGDALPSDLMREQHIKKNTRILNIEKIRDAGINAKTPPSDAAGRVLRRLIDYNSLETKGFLRTHRLNADGINGEEFMKNFLREMEEGLSGRTKSLLMLPSYINPDFEINQGEYPVLDAGGTTLKHGIAKISGEDITIRSYGAVAMAGVKEEVSHRGLYDYIAKVLIAVLHDSADCRPDEGTLIDHTPEHEVGNIKNCSGGINMYEGSNNRAVKNKNINGIGFCFSYPVDIRQNCDGRLIKWTKEILAPESEGRIVGESLLDALKKYDKTERSVAVLNDAVAVLLGGIDFARAYSAYIGLVCGTGVNVSYVENISQIGKLNTGPEDSTDCEELSKADRCYAKPNKTDVSVIHKGGASEENPFGAYAFETRKEDKFETQTVFSGEDPITAYGNKMIINIEAGNYDGFSLGEADSNICKEGGQILEKLCSGRYLGEIALQALILAQKEGLISCVLPPVITSEDISKVLKGEIPFNNFFDKDSSVSVKEGNDSASDIKVRAIFSTIVDRSAKITALAVSSAALKALRANNSVPRNSSDSGAKETPFFLVQSTNSCCEAVDVTQKKSNARPRVAVIAEGSVFYNMFGYRELFSSYLDEYLTLKNDVDYDIVGGEHLTLKGAALAAQFVAGKAFSKNN